MSSDLPMSDRVAGLRSPDALRGVASSWWLFLILGVLWILFGMFVLSYNVGSLLALAVFAGVTFLMTGLTQLMSATRAHAWRWLYLVGIYAVFYGFTELFAAFDLRGLGRRLDRQPPERPAV